MAEAYATWQDVQNGLEKPIPTALQPKVTEFLGRASRRLRMIRPKLAPALINLDPVTDDLPLFVKDMVVEAAEAKLRNFGGLSSESAGVFAVTRDEFWAKGRIKFDPADLAILDEHIDATMGELARGPVHMHVPTWRQPRPL